jgi:hypothetical protein
MVVLVVVAPEMLDRYQRELQHQVKVLMVVLVLDQAANLQAAEAVVKMQLVETEQSQEPLHPAVLVVLERTLIHHGRVQHQQVQADITQAAAAVELVLIAEAIQAARVEQAAVEMVARVQVMQVVLQELQTQAAAAVADQIHQSMVQLAVLV